jgi:hypothetical protein
MHADKMIDTMYQQMVMGLMPKLQAIAGELNAELEEYRVKK